MSRYKSATDLQVSPAVRALNPSVFTGPYAPLVVSERDGVKYTEIAVDAPKKKRLRQSTKPVMNKLETRFYESILTTYDKDNILLQAVRLELARGIWYRPDVFVTPHYGCTQPTFFEVKGPKVFRGGFENLKVAARVHKWAKFYLVWEDKQTGKWERQEILP